MARKNKNKGSWAELILFVMIIFCFFCILSLFDSPLTGDSGREWGKYLRSSWGGALIVPLMFVLYLCIAKLFKLRVIRIPRQILGTIQLYVSFAFMLGLLKETGWDSERTLFIPGSFGHGLAKFFVLNIGTFLTLILVICSFILTAYLFGSKILTLSIPQISMKSLKSLRFKKSSGSSSRRRPRREMEYENERSYPEGRPENILFPFDIPEPKFNDEYSDSESDSDSVQFSQRIPDPVFKPEPKPKPEAQHLDPFKKAINLFDDLIISLEAGEMNAPGKRKHVNRTVRKIRRPLPTVSIPAPDPVDDDKAKAKVKASSSKPESKRESKSESKSQGEPPAFPPPIDIFGIKQPFETDKNIMKDSEKQGREVIAALKNFGVSASIANIINGPSVIQYQLELAPGTKVNKLLELSDDLAMSLAVIAVRIEAPILGTHYAGVEVPAPERRIVSLRNILESPEYQDSTDRLPLALGMQSNGKIFVQGLNEIQHLLIAGSSGSGRSVFINSCILSMCFKRSPDELKLILIDTRHSDFTLYEYLPHLIAAPVNDVKHSIKALNWALNEVESRCSKFLNAKVKNLSAYNRKLAKEKRLPEIVIIINELADLMYSSGTETENLIIRLAQKAGLAGVHMILAAKTPSSEIITNPIRANIPAKVALTLSSANESINILDSAGSEKLTGKGDMLFKSSSLPLPVRIQAPFISEEKVSEFVDYLAGNLNPPDLIKF
ncbi:MAG: hypothetical protein IJP48_05095 [Synergistaceae bacterium]|nr:hypothetical protein [Synergistaceae bacterium]